MKLDAVLMQNIRWFLNLCENDSGSKLTDYRTIYLYADGDGERRQVTLGSGFTQDGGNLWKVIARYIELGGPDAAFFSPYKTRMKDASLFRDQAFLTHLRDASEHPQMQQAQNEIFVSAYLQPSIDWAEAKGFTLPLSFAVCADSFLHSGRMTPHCMNAFPDKTPKFGGQEDVWIFKYLCARWAWFQRSSGLLNTCIFRPKFFLTQIATPPTRKVPRWALRERSGGNWNFDCPLVIPEKGVIC